MRSAFLLKHASSLSGHAWLLQRTSVGAVRLRTSDTSRLSPSWPRRRAGTFVSFEPTGENRRLAASKEREADDEHLVESISPAEASELEASLEVKADASVDIIRLLGQQEAVHELAFWMELLKTQEQRHGRQGVKDTFYAMKKRAMAIPIEGAVADQLWTSFLDATENDKRFREDIWSFASEQSRLDGAVWSKFYAKLLAPVLAHEPSQAAGWARRMERFNPTFAVRSTLQELLGPAISSRDSLKAFKHVYLQHSDRDIYGKLIIELGKRELFTEALDYHHFLIQQNDLPTTSAEVEVLAKHVALFSDQRTFERFKISLARINRSLTAPLNTFAGGTFAMAADPVIDPDQGEPVIGMRKEVADATAARAFATTAFSVNLVIRGLLTFNFQTLGVAGMRELAVRCSDVTELSQYLDLIEGEGVRLDDRIYTKLLERLATARNQSMFEAVVESDMHPDVYEERGTQLRLLDQYSREQDWKQLHRTLTILTTLYQNPSEQGWNILLRGYMKAKDWRMITITLDDMVSGGILITEQTIKKSFFLLMPSRQLGKAPSSLKGVEHVKTLHFVTTMWFRIIDSGGNIPLYAWRQVLTHYGIMGRLGELEFLAHKLARIYGTDGIVVRSSSNTKEALTSDTVLEKKETLRRVQRFRASDMSQGSLNLIFSPAKQRAVVEWGFKTLGKGIPKQSRDTPSMDTMMPTDQSNQSQRQTPTEYDPMTQWDRGLRLLRDLSKLGLTLDITAIQAAVRHRLQILFYPGYETKKLENRLARKRNPFSLATMVKHINRITDRNLLDVSEALLEAEHSVPQEALAKAVLGTKAMTLPRGPLHSPPNGKPKPLVSNSAILPAIRDDEEPKSVSIEDDC